ncbi:MAG: hemerythrin domain-containing protein [Planctomycetes bacterium]|nr:hemerythrin domain-containing protein [Planctomycetota bacterium]
MMDEPTELHGQHGHIQALTAELLHQLTGPHPGLAPEDLAAFISVKLRVLRDTLSRHFQFEEAGGYMQDVLRRSPRHRGEVDRLLAQHVAILEVLSELDQIHDGLTLKDRASRVLELLAAHERDETELIQRSIADEPGGGD